MLLYIEGSFFQILEGAPQAVASIFSRIHSDGRHGQVTRIISEPIAQRDFEQWTMGYLGLRLFEAGRLTGENDFFADASCVHKLNCGRAQKLLNVFKGGSWRVDQTATRRIVSR
jgi:hypothetical protein